MSLLSSNTLWIWCTEFENGNADHLFPTCTCLAGESLWLDAHCFSYLTGATQTFGVLVEAQGATRLVRWSAEKQRLTRVRTVRSLDGFKEKSSTLKSPQSSSHCMKMLTWKFCMCIASCHEWPFWISNDCASGLCRCSYHATVRVANLCWEGRCYWGPQPYNTDTMKATRKLLRAVAELHSPQLLLLKPPGCQRSRPAPDARQLDKA